MKTDTPGEGSSSKLLPPFFRKHLGGERALFLTSGVAVVRSLDLFVLLPYLHKRGKRTSFTGFSAGPRLVCKVPGLTGRNSCPGTRWQSMADTAQDAPGSTGWRLSCLFEPAGLLGWGALLCV